MNKKGEIGMTLFVTACIIGCIFILWVIVGGINYAYKAYIFNRDIGSYCELAYHASDIDKKIQYLDLCIDKMNAENLTGYAAWWFTKPNNNMGELYQVMYSLQERLHDLQNMTKSSFEYQTGMQQIEDEVNYFVNGQQNKDGGNERATLSYFKTAYCFKHSITKYVC